MIEKRITLQLLEAGELVLTDLEVTALNLPRHSTTVTLELEGEQFHAQWSGRSQKLDGDMLAERLQDWGQEGGLLRLRMVDQVYRLTLLPRGTEFSTTKPPSIVRPRVTTTKNTSKASRKRTVDRQFHADKEYDWTSGPNQSIGFLTEARELLGEQLKAAGFDPLEIVELRLQGEELATLDDFDELLAVDVANVDRMPHQEAVARHALSRLRGRAVLADEVGLGKTIEAGLAIKELTLRGLAKRVLILCPAPLREQWREEMSHKFDLTFDIALNSREVEKQDKLILTLNLGTRALDKLTKKPWDIVIVDEAHRAAGKNAKKTRELITALTTACRYAFFLTATPVQNDLLELYRLVELLRPGTFTSVYDFKHQFMKSSDPRTPNDPAALRRLISSAMIRTTRAQAGVDRVQRRAVDVPVDLGPRERELYALSTELLRNVMVDPGDTMRRRSLALRLTASPFSMGTTAMRMAERHPNPRVRSVLNEVGHLAMDIEGSARENRALDITRDWVREHGRVLIFTQHTDTVTGLLRRMDAEGLQARSFHGSMSPTERAKTIAAFRSGEAPIMISTDAGAEGQNLQFCNCVLNYDLPWNPMRIEQRIGRVDRLTQPKDEVFVANLYARGTIDESVYQLLALKLRMFELLFGQVTTILGELDDSKSASFETRVMEALFAESDSKMQGLLAQLGTELSQARDRASTLIATDSGLSNWMASAFEHRKDLTKAGSNDLAPEVSERARIRQRRVQAWARKVLAALDAKLLHDTGEGEGAFLTAQFSEELNEELGGRTVMHLAFDRIGLEQHPDAELCAVGSPVFDELLGLLRMRGDMHATVPVIPEDIGPSPYKHASSLTLVRRRLIPSGSWSGKATFRTTIGEAETTEHLITADVNGHNAQRLPRRPLQDGETLPAAFDVPSKVIANFEKEAASQLETLRSDRATQVEEDQRRELTRIVKGYTAQIEEAPIEDRTRLRSALRSEERRLTRRPDIRARAKLLALTLDEDDWVVEEVWSGPNAAEQRLVYEWGLPEPVPINSEASSKPMQVLAMCSAAHWADDAETTMCESCNHIVCGACGDDAVFADCPLCGLSACGACRRKSGGLCLTCASPERAPEHDGEFAVAWRLNRGSRLLVGARVAKLVRSSGLSQILVSDDDLEDPGRQRVRSYAHHNGLPLDSGLALRDLTARPTDSDKMRARLHTDVAVKVELTVNPTSTAIIDQSAAPDLPDAAPVAVQAESEFRARELLRTLRDYVPPATPPTILLTRRSEFTDIYLEADQLVEESSVVADDGTLHVNDSRAVRLQWHEPQTSDPMLASAQLGGVTVSLERRNEAVLIEASIPSKSIAPERWSACPDQHSIEEQLGCFEYLQSLGTPGGRLGKRTHEILSIIAPFPTPTECGLVDRTIRQIADIVELNSDDDLVPLDAASIEALGIRSNQSAAPSINALPVGLGRALLSRASRSFTTAACNGLEIREAWHGHGSATHAYKIFDGEPLPPKLDDIGFRETDFGVCRDGHFYAAGSAELCSACQSWACRACDEVDHMAALTCPGCATSVCQRCLTANHLVRQAKCELCGDHACTDCGRDPQVVPCSMCTRAMCVSCRTGDTCPACSKLVTASDTQISALPDELALHGASVLVGSDNDAHVVLLNRGQAYEQAIVRNGAIARWVAFDRNQVDRSYRLRLAASRSLKKQVVPVFNAHITEAVITEPHVSLQRERKYRHSWSAAGVSSNTQLAAEFDTSEADLIELASNDFPALGRTPDPVTTSPPSLRPVLTTMPNPNPAAMVVRWEQSGYDRAITADGIYELIVEPNGETRSVAPWAEADDLPDWVAAAWDPTPTMHVHAKTKDVEAAIVELASLIALGIRTAKSVEWYAINPSDSAPAATMLARWMGLDDADTVGVFTDPRKVQRSNVINAVQSDTTVLPTGVLSNRSPAHPDVTAEALEAWMPDAAVKAPELRVLPADLYAALRRDMSPISPKSVLSIGAQFEQLVTVESGHQWRYERKLAAGQTDARRTANSTGNLLDSGVVDREGHFGVDCPPCIYCGGRTCSACIDGMIACTGCQTAICKRCVDGASPGFCPACIALRPPTRSEARQHGRLLLTRRMLIGTDAHHTAVFERSKEHWMLHDANGSKVEISSEAASRFLDERLAGAGSDGA
ncbi:DEAD/DEAH box helicase [Mycobacterium sp. SMC-21]|uniref:DEAD/DEAH box helicase n=1 Tax=Mycobacterium sp. SMC-21 TaxID=3381632 RepID=UPI003876789A